MPTGAATGAASGLSTLGWVGAGLGLASQLGRFLLGSKQNKLANQINPVYTEYQTSPAAKQSLSTTLNAYLGRMPGATQFGRNIQTSQANQMQNVLRNATDSSQALALGAATQGQADQAFADLATREAGYKTGILSQLNDAYSKLISEDRYKNEQMLQKYGIDLNAKMGLRGAGIGNQYGAAGDISSLLIKLSQLQKGGMGSFLG